MVDMKCTVTSPPGYEPAPAGNGYQRERAHNLVTTQKAKNVATHTVDYGPVINSQLTLWTIKFEDFLMRIWSHCRSI